MHQAEQQAQSPAQSNTAQSKSRGARRSHRRAAKRSVIAFNTVVLASLVAGSIAYGVFAKTITLDIDGQRSTVRTFAKQVKSVLNSHDVALTSSAVINVRPTASVDDGDTIEVRYKKNVLVAVDGRVVSHSVHAATVGSALKSLKIRPAKGAWISQKRQARLPRSGGQIIVSNPKRLTVIADGKKSHLTSAAPTAEKVLNEAGVELRNDDEVAGGRGGLVKNNQVLRVTRVQSVEKTENVKTAPKVVYKDDKSMERGTTKVLDPGKAGQATEHVSYVVANGKRRQRVVLSSKVLSEPKTRVVARGTAEAPTVASGSVWDRIAKCESGGNWKINTGNGYYGGLQFSAATWRSVGGPGLPHQHSREVQIKYAKILQARSGWGQWSCAAKVGVR